MIRQSGNMYFTTLFWAIVIVMLAFVALDVMNSASMEQRYREHITEITNLHVQRVAACLDFYKIYNQAQCEDYLFTMGQDEAYYSEVLKR